MRFFAAILLIVVLAIGGGVIATTAYQAGLDTAITTATNGTVVAPVVVPAYGFGWHGAGFGFGFFSLFATLFFVFIVLALLRAVFFRGRSHRDGWGPGRSWGAGHGPWDGQGRSPWEARAHDTFDTWHRQSHESTSEPTSEAPPFGDEPT